MDCIIKNSKYIRNTDDALIKEFWNVSDLDLGEIVRGEVNRGQIVDKETIFKVENFTNYKRPNSKTKEEFVLLSNKDLGFYITKLCNIKYVESIQDIKDKFSVRDIIANKDVMILISQNGKKTMVKRVEEDAYDEEKAILYLLLKRENIKPKDINLLVNAIKHQE